SFDDCESDLKAAAHGLTTANPPNHAESARIAAVQTNKTLIATHRIAMAFVLICAPGCSERFRKSLGKTERKTSEDLFERRRLDEVVGGFGRFNRCRRCVRR